MSKPSWTNFIMKRPYLDRWFRPLSRWYCEVAGWRQLGLKSDDLIPEENDTVLLALKRLPPKEAYDRVFRLRRAFQCSLAHQLLPKDQQTTEEEDYLYLTPIIKQIEAENKEKGDLEAMIVKKRKL
ncbi:Cytochrome b-c1 complex subunit 7 [Toensbergia leucococca]|nr:Cytochrome b-c1 complex subunit 7 [Toensbergia leucococca]